MLQDRRLPPTLSPTGVASLLSTVHSSPHVKVAPGAPVSTSPMAADAESFHGLLCRRDSIAVKRVVRSSALSKLDSLFHLEFYVFCVQFFSNMRFCKYFTQACSLSLHSLHSASQRAGYSADTVKFTALSCYGFDTHAIFRVSNLHSFGTT